jgi:hypothetical protein
LIAKFSLDNFLTTLTESFYVNKKPKENGEKFASLAAAKSQQLAASSQQLESKVLTNIVQCLLN